MTQQARKPAAFGLDDPDVVVAPQRGEGRWDARVVVVTPEREADRPSLPELPAAPPRVRLPLASMFWLAALGLLVLAAGLGIARLIEDLWARAEWLGGLGAALAGVAAVASVAIIAREIVALARLSAIGDLRERAVETLASDDRMTGRAVARELVALTRATPALARARARVESHLGEIIDGRDLIQIAERELMGPLDAEARRLVSGAAKRVSIVTAVSPRAAVDMMFVLITALGLVRRLAMLYGARPGTLGLLRLVRHVVSHLAVTGGMAVSDGLVQQVIGHGLAARLSARLGEGVLNGLLTARLGLATIEVARPLPFSALKPPTINDLAATLLRSDAGDPAPPAERPVGEQPQPIHNP